MKIFREILIQLLTPAREALRRYGWAFGLCQAAAIATVVLYYRSPSFQGVCERLTAWEARGGILFAAGVSAIAGGILPEIAKALTGKVRGIGVAYFKDVLFNAAFFAMIGIFMKLFIDLQGWVFGYDLNWQTIVQKVCADQFLVEPLFFSPFGVLVYEWRRQNFDLLKTARRLNGALYRERVLPLLSTVWLYWIPIMSCAYAMPVFLQFPFFVCTMAGWSLLLVYIVQFNPESQQALEKERDEIAVEVS